MDSEKYNECNMELTDETTEWIQIIVNFATNSDLDVTTELKMACKNLWRLNAIQKTFDSRFDIFRIANSTSYFLNEIERIMGMDDEVYIPTDQDVLLLRAKTIDIDTTSFESSGSKFKLFDIGDEIMSSPSWIEYLPNDVDIASILFIASLADYCEVCQDDENMNAMLASVELFRIVINHERFEQNSIVLFCNKADLFYERIRNIPISVCFSKEGGWPGEDEWFNGDPSDSSQIIDHIKQVFDRCNEKAQDRTIYTHITTATDQNNVQKVFSDVSHIAINYSLQTSGLV